MRFVAPRGSLAVLFVAGCTVVSGVDDLVFDLTPTVVGAGGGGPSATSAGGGVGGAGADGGGGGDDGIGGSRPPLEPEGGPFLVGSADGGPASNHDPGILVTDTDVAVIAWSDLATPEGTDTFSGILYDSFPTPGTCDVCADKLNVTKDGSQLTPRGSAFPSGGGVFVWNTTSQSITGQIRFVGSDGAIVGTEQTVPFGDWITTGAPWIGFAGAPDAVVTTWVGQDASERGIFATVIAKDMSPVPDEVAVNDTVAGNQSRPAVAVDAAGRVLAVWRDGGTRIAGRFLEVSALLGVIENLTLDGPEFTIDDTADAKCAPVVAASEDSFAVVFAEGDCAGDYPRGGKLVTRRIAADGTVGERSSVLTAGEDDATAPDIAFDGEHFHIVWTDAVPGDEPLGLFMRRLRVNGTFLDPTPVPVLDGTDEVECNPRIDVGGNGRIAIAWAECTTTCIPDRPLDPDPPCVIKARFFQNP